MKEVISASDDSSSACLHEIVPVMATVAASRRCLNDKLLIMSLFWFKLLVQNILELAYSDCL